ncbi:uncharacterized protein LOC131942498 [Physella acuta]|uniref:uncharacterized protein LOC131942498 n=1 Tax=Physella acuta TaxID=109671 RepID=UPI0027DE6FD9|nr:uncharacterized protein LOC131942498 [Physella acuta]
MGNCILCRSGRHGANEQQVFTDIQKYHAAIQKEEETRWRNTRLSVDSTDNTEDIIASADSYPEQLTIDTPDPREYNFSFENLVFEGGGNKGLAYVGCIKYLEELGLMNNVKRLGGSSAGAITAALIALGYNSEDIRTFFEVDTRDIFLDHSCGYLSLLPNLLRKFGWNPGIRIRDWLGEKIKEKSPEKNNPDMTFYELYKHRNIELCVVVTNLNQMRSEYCHPKTTPDMPIRDALRMTMAIPAVFSPTIYDIHGQADTYVDGGVLCNYPLHCYDGWYLSMRKEDSLLTKMTSLQNFSSNMSRRFYPRNEKTLGFLLYDEAETEIMRFSLEARAGTNEPAEPVKTTKLFEEKRKKMQERANAEREHRKIVTAVEAFMTALDKHNKKDLEHIERDELENALRDTEVFSEENATILFGNNITVDNVLDLLDKDGTGTISIPEILHFLEERGIRMQTRIHGYGRKEITSFVQFLKALKNTMYTNLKFIYVDEQDVDRTIGINTGHVGTSDYDLEPADKEFVIDRGYYAARNFFRHCVASGRHCERRLASPREHLPDENGSVSSFYDNMQHRVRIENGAAEHDALLGERVL